MVKKDCRRYGDVKMKYKVVFGDSVTKDMKLLQEDLRYKTIEEMWTENSNLALQRNGKEIKNWKGQDVLCYNKEYGSIFSTPIEIIRHKVNKNIWKLTASNQDFIEVTEDHSIIDNNLEEIKPSNAKHILFMKTIKNKNIKSENYIKEVYNLLGMVLANGSLNKHYNNNTIYQLSLSFEYIKEYYNDILKPIINTYNISYCAPKYKKTDCKLYKREFMYKLYKLGICGTSKTKRVPKFMFNETEKNIREYLKGYMTGDGTIMLRNGRPIIRGTSVNKLMLEDLRILFAICGISCSIFKESKTNKYKGKDSGTYSHHINVLNRDIYRDEIGFSCKFKSDRLEKVVQKSKNIEYHKRTILKKEIIEYNDYVYDICIPETQNFFCNNVLVHNTDSFGVPTGNKDNFIKNSEHLQKQVQATYDDFCVCFNMKENHLKLEFEKTFEKVLFGDAKKRYAGKICYYKGKQVQDMLIMGFELVRSDCSSIAKETQKKFFDMLFLENKERKELTLWLRERIKKIRNDEYSYIELGIPTPLNKPINEYVTNLPIVRAVEYSNNELGLDIQVGEKIKLIYVRGNSLTDIIGFRELKELPKNIILDYEKHIDESIRGKMERIFSALNWSIDELEFSGSLLDF